MKIYTKTGDAGETGLFSGERVPKSHALVEAYGTVDEANSLLGVAQANGLQPEVADAVKQLQVLLFHLAADLATLPGKRKVERISAAKVARVEAAMDGISARLPQMRHFILPGGNGGAATLQLARAVIRRAEREAVRATGDFSVNPEALILLNRLSDYLFLLARLENHLAGAEEILWVPCSP